MLISTMKPAHVIQTRFSHLIEIRKRESGSLRVCGPAAARSFFLGKGHTGGAQFNQLESDEPVRAMT
jgi:hypothetical protein